MVIAVIGAGTLGLVTLKNLLEEGLDAVGFERSSEVGGLWVQRTDPNVTSSLPTTQVNFSKQRLATTDFPFPDDVPTHPTSYQVAAYFSSYADHFHLRQHINFNCAVLSVDFAPSPTEAESDSERRYIIRYQEGGEVKEFLAERVVMATGLNQVPFVPKIEGIERFGGEVLHSRSFRDASKYAGKSVIVVGSRASAADVSSALCKAGAKQVYLSHRGGLLAIPRNWRGKAFDHHLTHRLIVLRSWIERYVPFCSHFSGWSTTFFCRMVQRTTFNIKKEWGFDSEPQVEAYASVPTISDDLIPLLAAGRIISVPSISSIQLSGFILFNTFSTSLPSSTPLELPPSSVDAIIYATGYSSSVDGLPLSPEIFEHLYLPSSSTEGHRQEKTPNGLPYLYEYALPPSLPTLAILVNAYGAIGAPLGQDIHSMWLAGLWSGQIPMPSTEEMKRAADADLEWYQSLRTITNTITPGARPLSKNLLWASLAGCDITFFTSYFSPRAWYWSLTHPRLSRMVLDGVGTGAIFRLSAKGRKHWNGAEEAVWRANGYSGRKEGRERERKDRLWGLGAVALVAGWVMSGYRA